jgi:transposase-like protein
LVTHIGVD